MPVTLDLSDEALTRLRVEADRRSISVEELVGELAASLPSVTDESLPRKLRFFAIGRSTSGRSAADADEMLAEGFGQD